MKTIDLIDELATELKPVEVVRFTFFDILKVLGFGCLSILVTLAILGLRTDFAEQVVSFRFIFETVWLSIVCGFSVLAALSLGIPSSKKRHIYIVPWLAVALIGASTLYSFFTYSNPFLYLGHGFSCVVKTVSIGILPTTFLAHMVNRAAVLKRRMAGLMILLTGVSFGLIGVQLTCFDSTPLHSLIWHILPAAILVGLGVAISHRIFRKI